jgi:hypothetical protein
MSARTKNLSPAEPTDAPLREALRFHSTAASSASPQAVYDVLADLRTHLSWGGPGSANDSQCLISVDAPPGLATVGTSFTSTGRAGKDTFHDRSTVTTAVPGQRFGFSTQSRLERRRKAAWQAVFTHDFQLTSTATGSALSYTCAVHPVNYVPYWLQPGLKVLTRAMVTRIMTKNVRSLVRLAESRG